VISAAATAMVLGPAFIASVVTSRDRAGWFGVVVAGWSIGLLIGLPVYFPGERREALATGLALVARGLPSGISEERMRAWAAALPEEPSWSRDAVPLAGEVEVPVVPVAAPLADHEIALPYEGEGRRLSVSVGFQHGGRLVEHEMLLDTGATYTTLPLKDLRALGIVPPSDTPTIVLHTANGEREAQIVLLDRIWLGDLAIDGVAIATCEPCASSDTAGLLGLNVAGNYNLTIDADRREVVFAARADRNRRLDVAPFSDVDAQVVRYPGGRVEVDVRFVNRSARDILSANAEIRCDAQRWMVELPPVGARAEQAVHRRLPEHEPCDGYQVNLLSARW
jgi:hypothetical protein